MAEKPPNRQDESPSPEGQEGIPAPTGRSNLIDTDYVIGQDNVTTRRFGVDVDLHGKVFSISSLLILFFVFITLALPDQMGPIFNAAKGFLTDNLSWLFLLAANIFVIVAVVLIFTPLGKVRIGGMDAKPDFSYAGWFAMLFAAGMGIGLMFYGVSEPITHFGTSLAAPLRKAACVPTGRRWARPRAMNKPPSRWAWPRPSSTGGCTPGRSMPWWPWRWPCSRTTRACH